MSFMSLVASATPSPGDAQIIGVVLIGFPLRGFLVVIVVVLDLVAILVKQDKPDLVVVLVDDIGLDVVLGILNLDGFVLFGLFGLFFYHVFRISKLVFALGFLDAFGVDDLPRPLGQRLTSFFLRLLRWRISLISCGFDPILAHGSDPF